MYFNQTVQFVVIFLTVALTTALIRWVDRPKNRIGWVWQLFHGKEAPVQQRCAKVRVKDAEIALKLFQGKMERDLLRGPRKGCMEDPAPDSVMVDLMMTVGKLAQAVRMQRPVAIEEHAVDLAVLALTVMDATGALRPEE